MREDRGQAPRGWIEHGFTVELQGEGRSAGTDATQTGQLLDVSDFGITVHHRSGSEELERFYPWSAIRSIRHRPDIAPPGG